MRWNRGLCGRGQKGEQEERGRSVNTAALGGFFVDLDSILSEGTEEEETLDQPDFRGWPQMVYEISLSLSLSLSLSALMCSHTIASKVPGQNTIRLK